MAVCASCKAELRPEFESQAETEDYQFDNALWIGFFGGYGMFVESPEVLDNPAQMIRGASYEAVICHDCAHKLCVENPWIENLLMPLRSHAHKADYWQENPDHEGWDSPKNRR